MPLTFVLEAQPLFGVVLQWLATVLDVVGVVVVASAAFVAVMRYLRREMAHTGRKLFRQVDAVRHEFGQRMILGLEFFLAGDIIRLIVTPNLEGLYRLGAIVVIRTVLSYFLTNEVEQKLHKH